MIRRTRLSHSEGRGNARRSTPLGRIADDLGEQRAKRPAGVTIPHMAETAIDESSLLLQRSAQIADALHTQNWPKLREALCDLHPSDIADLVIALPMKYEGILFRVLPRQLATRVFAYLPHEYQEELLASLSGREVEEII